METQKICVASHKGGVAKSTTAVNLAAGLAHEGKKVLLVDTDAQGNATAGLGVDTENAYTLAELLCSNVEAKDVIQSTYIKNLDIIPSDLTLAIAEIELSTTAAKEFKLRGKLNNVSGYDFIIFDCPPSFGTVVVNVFTTADKIILPMSLECFALQGISTFIDTVNYVNKKISSHVNHSISLLGILITRHDTRTNISKDILSRTEDSFTGKLFATAIPQNIKLHEAQADGRSIFDYDKNCKGSVAYRDFTREILNRVQV